MLVGDGSSSPFPAGPARARRARDGPMIDPVEWRKRAALALFLAVVFCQGFHLAFGDHGLHLGDEGYLWYGV